MELLDSRRLTGPNLLWERPGAVIDVRFAAADPERAVALWRAQVRRMLDAVGWSGEQTCVRRFADGASLAVSAPRDQLYAATDINEWAWDAACEVLAGEDEPPLARSASRLREIIAEDDNPRLLALQAAAREQGLQMLIDDDYLSIGLGDGSRIWKIGDLPAPMAVDWPRLHRVPVALVTGTNGKTTSVRLAAAIVRAAGLCAGTSSTDWIAVDDEVLDYGDYSGPEGARRVLRDQRVGCAILETARGGLLRRGLALEYVNAALITNVAEDHLGEFGVHDLAELAEVKWVVTRALGELGRLVLNADDPLLVERGLAGKHRIVWFSPDAENPVLREHVGNGGDACSVEDASVVYHAGGERRILLPVADIPITLGGAATHNIANVLGVVGLTRALGLPFSAIAAGLRSLRPEDNPGRCNLFTINGARVIVDFAHNPHGVEAFFAIARNLPARRRLLVIGQAGDRSDEAIRGLARAAWRTPLDRVIIKGMPEHSRGRPAGEVAELLREEFLRLGAEPDILDYREKELDAVRAAVDWAGPDDLVILLVHAQREAVLAYLGERQTGG